MTGDPRARGGDAAGRDDALVHGPRGLRGFTLLELLVVLALMSLLMGIGAGLFKRASLGKRMAVPQVKDAVLARTFAVEQSAQSTVEVDAERSLLRSTGFVSVGNWHFEDDRSRGWPTDADLATAAELIDDGFIGRGIRFATEGRGAVVLGRSTSFDPESGVLLEIAVRIDQPQDATLIAKGSAYALALTSDFGLTFAVRARAGGLLGRGEGEQRSLAVTRAIEPSRWTRIVAAYDGRRMQITADNRDAGRREFGARIPVWTDPDAPLQLGTDEGELRGDFDEVRVAAAVVSESEPLAEGVRFERPGIVWFDRTGRLDPLHHSTPAVVTLLFDEGRGRRDVIVGLFGEIQ